MQCCFRNRRDALCHSGRTSSAARGEGQGCTSTGQRPPGLAGNRHRGLDQRQESAEMICFSIPPRSCRRRAFGGKVAAVRIQGNEIVQTFGAQQPASFARGVSGNYMAYRDNELHFGKLTMHDTDMILIDMDPQDPFDFYLDHYQGPAGCRLQQDYDDLRTASLYARLQQIEKRIGRE